MITDRVEVRCGDGDHYGPHCRPLGEPDHGGGAPQEHWGVVVSVQHVQAYTCLADATWQSPAALALVASNVHFYSR